MPNISDFMQEGEDSELLENAIDSIKLGIEDFKNPQPSRLLSAIRNFHSGVLLLCKEVLRRLCPEDSNEVHIKERQQAIKDSDGNIIFVGIGKRTVHEYQIEERFKNLKINVDLSGLKKLTEIRNEIEHYYTIKQRHLMEEAFAAALPIVRQVIVSELKNEPVGLLGTDIWNFLVEHAKLYKEEEQRCRDSFSEIVWNSPTLEAANQDFGCSKCGSSLIKQTNVDNKEPEKMGLLCTQCGEQLELEIILEEAISKAMEFECYDAAMQAQNEPLETCPECDKKSYVLKEDRCLICGFSLDGAECGLCSEPITVHDYLWNGGKYCSYHAHIISKDD